MRILCVLQNAWGDRELPSIFIPNPLNKSAKVIRKMVGEHRFFFCNTTPKVTATAKGCPPPDDEHFKNLVPRFARYDLVLVCGAQAKKTVEKHRSLVDNCYRNSAIMFVPHPASRSLSNIQIAEIRQKIEEYEHNV